MKKESGEKIISNGGASVAWLYKLDAQNNK